MTNTNVKFGFTSNGIVITDLPIEVLRAMRDSIDAAIRRQEIQEDIEHLSHSTDPHVRTWLSHYLAIEKNSLDNDYEDEDDYEDDFEDDDFEDDEFNPCENCNCSTYQGCSW